MIPQGLYNGYPHIWGIAGTNREESVGGRDQQVFYVNSAHPAANDNNYGLDPDAPLATIQELIDRSTGASFITHPHLNSYDVIYVGANVTESVIVPGTGVPTYVSIVGAGNSSHAPTWTAATAAGTALTLRREGWRISGFTFEVGAAGTAIRLDEVPASSYSAYKTTIDNCRFDGLWGGLYGVNFSGAPHRVTIDNCEFLEFRRGNSTAFAIIVSDSAHTNPYECHINGCTFWENENHVGSLGGIRSFNMSTITNNIFHEGVLIAATIKLDLRGGSQGHNIVTGNVFGGDYSNPGGYYGHAAAPDFWVGNFAEDVAEAEVGDNGLTIAPPAA